MRHFILSLTLGVVAASTAFATDAPAPACPAALQFNRLKTELMIELQAARTADTGLFLTRRLVALHTTAPNWHAQELLDAGIRARMLDRPDDARAAFDALIDYCPGFAEGYHQRALLRRSDGDFAGALRDLDTALTKAPDHLGAMARKAQVLGALGRVKDAAAVRAEVLQLNPWMPPRLTDFGAPGSDA